MFVGRVMYVDDLLLLSASLHDLQRMTDIGLCCRKAVHLDMVFNASKSQAIIRVGKGKGKASSLDIAPLTVLNSGTLQPRKWQP